ncbi:MAG: hypothetical protein LC737_03375, partial [Chloroflexi bacterium]|nr:hypothetical protein [Chloroflexota bacterium]
LTLIAQNWSTLAFALVSQIVITLAFLAKPHDRAARALFLWAWSLSHTYPWSLGMEVSDVVGGTGFWLFRVPIMLTWLVFWSEGLYFTLLFPEPHALVRKYPRLRFMLYAAALLTFGAFVVIARFTSASTLEWLGRWTAGEWLIASLSLTLTIVVAAHNYRTQREPKARQKLNWLIFAFLLSGVLGLVIWFVPGLVLGRPLISAGQLGLALLPFPFVVVTAIVRHQLFDIEIVVRRTLIYSAVTLLLLFTYFASVVVLQALVQSLVGRSESELVTVASTLLIAALFNPLRQRVQSFIDKRFYRRKYDAALTLAVFGLHVRDETNLDNLERELIDAVQETVQPKHVSLWLRKGPR